MEKDPSLPSPVAQLPTPGPNQIPNPPNVVSKQLKKSSVPLVLITIGLLGILFFWAFFYVFLKPLLTMYNSFDVPSIITFTPIICILLGVIFLIVLIMGIYLYRYQKRTGIITPKQRNRATNLVLAAVIIAVIAIPVMMLLAVNSIYSLTSNIH